MILMSQLRWLFCFTYAKEKQGSSDAIIMLAMHTYMARIPASITKQQTKQSQNECPERYVTCSYEEFSRQ